ncbi:uncharacterized protein LOC6052799 [Culex quinquefasciatus]|uniref:uncharacterized protein LOC6052799 n=1 Tax=Culex quinquefasciatus TaxID=7176 RepID=UPI0018E34235|nr:uncharacterized protein LOC6052799 [Culex quinquefasciatus]XP_038121789.1 uncharacterized protein LOC6052799 [Culex quinquefasciatus]
MAVPSERPCTNMLDGRSAPASSRETTPDKHARRKVANLQVRAERSWTNMLDGRSAPASSRETTLDELPCRKVANLQVPAKRRWMNILAGRSPTCKFPRDVPGRTCSTDGPHQQVPAERRWTNMLAGRSSTIELSPRSWPIPFKFRLMPPGIAMRTLDEHARRKVGTLGTTLHRTGTPEDYQSASSSDQPEPILTRLERVIHVYTINQ